MEDKDIIRSHCDLCYWHIRHGCHVDTCGVSYCINTVALEEVSKSKRETE